MVESASGVTYQSQTKNIWTKYFKSLYIDTHKQKECDMSQIVTQHEEEVIHAPRLTAERNPAHGCETCDGEDICTCPHKEFRATCIICGGKWPECTGKP